MKATFAVAGLGAIGLLVCVSRPMAMAQTSSDTEESVAPSMAPNPLLGAWQFFKKPGDKGSHCFRVDGLGGWIYRRQESFEFAENGQMTVKYQAHYPTDINCKSALSKTELVGRYEVIEGSSQPGTTVFRFVAESGYETVVADNKAARLYNSLCDIKDFAPAVEVKVPVGVRCPILMVSNDPVSTVYLYFTAKEIHPTKILISKGHPTLERELSDPVFSGEFQKLSP